MRRIFLDSSVLIAASGSKHGASALIVSYCSKGAIEGFLSKYVYEEVRKNIAKKFSEQEKRRLNYILLKGGLKVIDNPNAPSIKEYQNIISLKDVPILVAAHALSVDILVTHNTKDFMKFSVRKKMHPIQILTPKKYIHMLNNQIGR